MELLAIPLGCQNTAAKWLVMRRCAVLEILMYFVYIPVSAFRAPCIPPSSRTFNQLLSQALRGKNKIQNHA